MAVRKRRWRTRNGDMKEAWVVDYVDQEGDRHIETFQRKKDAEARASRSALTSAPAFTPPSPNRSRWPRQRPIGSEKSSWMSVRSRLLRTIDSMPST